MDFLGSPWVLKRWGDRQNIKIIEKSETSLLYYFTIAISPGRIDPYIVIWPPEYLPFICFSRAWVYHIIWTSTRG